MISVPRRFPQALVTLVIISIVLFHKTSPDCTSKVKLSLEKQHYENKIQVSAKPAVPKLRRLLQWNTVYGGASGFFLIGKSNDRHQGIAKTCKYPCEFVTDRNLLNISHAVIFHGWSQDLPVRNTTGPLNKNVLVPAHVPVPRDLEQLYVYMTYEPFARIRENMEAYRDFFNLTMTYLTNSDIILEYGRVIPKTEADMKHNDTLMSFNNLAKRKNLVAWMVSNCNDAPSGRQQLVQELQKHIPISIYGKCGNLSCKSKDRGEGYAEIAETHKFYLSFENSLCKDYVTEKFFHALENKMVPVVYGKANYGRISAPGSFINVDSFPSAEALAHYLLWLDENDAEYLKYFDWTKTLKVDLDWHAYQHYCSICEKIHEDYGVKRSIVDINVFLRRDSNNNSVCSEPQRFF